MFREGVYSAEYQPEVDGIRMVAVVSVVLFHLGVTGFSGGFVGVDVFFVISGYLITRNIFLEHESGTWSFGNFYLRRARRLLPALLFTIAVTSLFAYLVLWPSHLIAYGKSAALATIGASNFLFMSEAGYFDIAAHSKPLLHTWSLAVEEQFYLVWPLTLIAMLSINRRVSFAIFALVVVAAFVAADLFLSSHREMVFYMMPFRIGEFGVGIFAFFLSKWSLSERWLREITAFAGLVMIIISVITFSDDMRFPGTTALLPCLGTALLILSAKDSLVGSALRSPYAVHVGLISYSFYLIHWPVLVIYGYQYGTSLSGLEKLGIFVFSAGAAHLMYKFVETPFRKGKKNPVLKSSKGFVAASAFFASVSIMIGVQMVQAKGWPERIANEFTVGDINSSAEANAKYGCTGEQVVPSSKVCSFAETSAQSGNVYLMGDSHLGGLRPLFHHLASDRQVGVSMLFASACPALFGVKRITVKDGVPSVSQRCHDASKHWAEKIEDPAVEWVVLASRWDFYVKRQDPANRFFLVEEEGDPLSLDHSRKVFELGFEKTLKQLVEMGKKVIVFSQAPELSFEPKDCMTDPEKCRQTIPVIGVETRQHIEQVIRRAASAYSNANSVYPFILSDLFCPDSPAMCRVVGDGAVLYEDISHVTDLGGVYISRHLDAEFLEFWNQGAQQ